MVGVARKVGGVDFAYSGKFEVGLVGFELEQLTTFLYLKCSYLLVTLVNQSLRANLQVRPVLPKLRFHQAIPAVRH